ncbi:MAG: hypothetical protein ACYDEG_01860, partial [bacterium]
MENKFNFFKKLLYFDNVLFLLSVCLYLDVFSLVFYGHSVIYITTGKIFGLLGTITVEKIIYFLVGFGVFFTIVIILINNLLSLLIYSILSDFIYYIKKILRIKDDSGINSKKFNNISKNDLLRYAIKNNNQVAFNIFDNHEKYLKKMREMYRINLSIVILSLIDIAFYAYGHNDLLSIINNNIPVLNIPLGVLYVIFLIIILYSI